MRPWNESLKVPFAPSLLIGTMALNSNLARIFYERAGLWDVQIAKALTLMISFVIKDHFPLSLSLSLSTYTLEFLKPVIYVLIS